MWLLLVRTSIRQRRQTTEVSCILRILNLLHKRSSDRNAFLAVLIIVKVKTVNDQEVTRVTIVLLNPVQLLCGEVVLGKVRSWVGFEVC